MIDFTLGLRHMSLHQLDLILRLIQQLLLTLKLLGQLINARLQILAGSHGALDMRVQTSFFFLFSKEFLLCFPHGSGGLDHIVQLSGCPHGLGSWRCGCHDDKGAHGA